MNVRTIWPPPLVTSGVGFSCRRCTKGLKMSKQRTQPTLPQAPCRGHHGRPHAPVRLCIP
ncbi:hypothetical protein BD309DRAFT_966217, partial [Dichomitus squalens]